MGRVCLTVPAKLRNGLELYINPQCQKYRNLGKTVAALLDSQGFSTEQDPKQPNLTSKLALFRGALSEMTTRVPFKPKLLSASLILAVSRFSHHVVISLSLCSNSACVCVIVVVNTLTVRISNSHRNPNRYFLVWKQIEKII